MESELDEIRGRHGIVGRERELRLILMAARVGRHVLLEGPVGVGKTLLARAVADHLGREFVRVDGDERITESKLIGYWDPPSVLKMGYVREAFVEGPLTRAALAGGVLFINELNRLPESAQNALLPVMDEGIIHVPHLGILRAREGFLIIATQNPEESVGVTRLSEALRDRFVLVRLEYQSEEEEVEIVRLRASASEEVAETAVKIVRATREDPSIRRGGSVRSAIDLAALAEEMGVSGVEGWVEAALMVLPQRIEVFGSQEEARSVVERIVRRVLGEGERGNTPAASRWRGGTPRDGDDEGEGEREEGEGESDKGTYSDVLRRARRAAAVGGVRELVELAEVNRYAVARAISEGGLGDLAASIQRDPPAAVRLYRQVRWYVREDLRRVFRSLVTKAIVRGGFLIASRVRGRSLTVRGSYEPGMDFDGDETIQKMLESGKLPEHLTYDDVVGLDRAERSRSAVIILDASGSMGGLKIASAALTAAVASHLMRGGEYAVLGFNSHPFVLKGGSERRDLRELISGILDLAPVGYTNLRSALSTALSEGRKLSRRDRRFILITDGLYNVGGDPRLEAARLRGLFVIHVPDSSPRGSRLGERICMDLSKVAGGSFLRLDRLQDVPLAVARALSG